MLLIYMLLLYRHEMHIDSFLAVAPIVKDKPKGIIFHVISIIDGYQDTVHILVQDTVA